MRDMREKKSSATHRSLQVVAAGASDLLALLQVNDVKHGNQVHVVGQPGFVARRTPRALDGVVVLRLRLRRRCYQSAAPTARTSLLSTWTLSCTMLPSFSSASFTAFSATFSSAC